LAALAAGFFAAALPAPAAHAQSFFQALFGSLTGGHSGRAYAPFSRDDRFPVEPGAGNERPAAEARGSGTLCVRLCDGRHFPIPRSANGVALNSAKVCSSLCPHAKTEVFHGSKPDHAVAGDGTRYADLDNAFAYRDRIVPDCSCTGNGPGGLAQIDVESDPTLRAGDVVATAGGLTVFKGANTFPYKTADFTPIDDYARVNAAVRRKLADVKVDPTATPATPIQSFASTEDEKPVVKKRRKPPVQAARTENPGRSPFGWFR
jgi:hypothetical protein